MSKHILPEMKTDFSKRLDYFVKNVKTGADLIKYTSEVPASVKTVYIG